MTQRFFAFLTLLCMAVPGAFAVDTAPASPSKSTVVSKVQKSPEERYLAGHECLQKSDASCAQIALAGIRPTSSYAKILQAEIAALQQDFDSVLRLLIPLQAETRLLPAALGSLHATLAQAYEHQGNILLAVERRAEADRYLQPPDVASNQQHLLNTLTAESRESLLEMRGESANSAVQGWIDLALAVAHSPQRGSALAQWRQAYPDHHADETTLAAGVAPLPTTHTKPSLTGKVALLLPLDIPAFAFAAEAVRTGFIAAQKAAGHTAEILIYSTDGHSEGTAAVYRQAMADGAQYIVGPLTRSEVAGLTIPGLVALPTIALNVLDEQVAAPQQLIQFGLPVEEEAVQLARFARRQGMQTAVIVSADAPLGKRMAQAFASEWTDQGGVVVLQVEFGEQSNLVDIKAQLISERADMIFLAANPSQARWIRPYMNAATPTFALSHIFDGQPQNPDNMKLNAIHFIDMPWMLNPDSAEYASFREASATLPPDALRWFAVGVDAWKLLSEIAAGQSNPAFPGLTGDIMLQDNRVQRELPMAQFRSDGIALE